MTPRPAPRRAKPAALAPLERLVEDFVAALGDSSLSDVRALQPPPHGSLAYGASGAISVLLHHAARSSDPAALRTARRWMRELDATRARTLFPTPDTGERYRESSLWFGAPGIRCVRILVALAEPRTPDAAPDAVRAIGRFVAQVSAAQVAAAPATPDTADLILGAAGNLVAVNLLSRVVPAGALEPLADRLAAHVAASIWADETRWSFAHGWPGMAFALLQRAQVAGRPVADELASRLRTLASRDAPARPGFATALPYSWCNGVAGRVLLWVKAFELTGDPSFLERARRDAGRIPASPDPVNQTLCCGTAGWAYAFLALDRVDPGAGWYERAVQLCTQIVASGPGFEHPSGLLKGYSGVLYLASDLADAANRGFPFVEALPIPPRPS